MRTSATAIGLVLLLAGAALAVVDLRLAERGTIVVYTTPALRDLLEKDVAPRFERATGHELALVYVPAGQQYNRLRLSGDRPEADLLLHASPLFLEKAYATGHVDATRLPVAEVLPDAFKGREVEGGRVWYAFAWSPLVEVVGPGADAVPDLATLDVPFGFPHPLLSNNGAYAVVLFESVGRAAGARALANTRVQPTNARANIGGVADGSFDVTLGYEAVVLFYEGQGADVSYEIPLVAGERVTTPVVFSAARVHGDRHAGTDALLAFLFEDASQRRLADFHFRSVLDANATPPGQIDLDATPHRTVTWDWSRWEDLEEALLRYEVRS